jgi:pantoate--beta-alanine ligase
VRLLRTFGEVRASRSGSLALVPTMGFLHEGHLSLIEAAGELAETVVVSLFVNPLQFDQADDLARYPRALDRDAGLAEAAGADILFAPGVSEMYPLEPATRVSVAPLTVEMEGAHRRGHFEGVATVVAKLFAGLQPDVALFGRKDAQQLAVLSRMAADLSFPVRVVGYPTVRESDGLALSSRNVLLSPAERKSAVAISRGLLAAAAAVAAGERVGVALEGVVAAEVVGAGGLDLEYAALADAATATRIPALDRPAFLAVAVRAGAIRLIDNVGLTPDGETDPGVRLTRPSILYAKER